MSDVGRANVWDELRLLQDSVMKIWGMYVNWFTWSLGANLLAISWIITAKENPKPELIAGLGVVMSAALAFSIIGCARAYGYFRNAETRAQALLADSPGSDAGLFFGGTLSRSALWLIPITLSVVLLAWLALVYKYGSWSLMLAWLRSS